MNIGKFYNFVEYLWLYNDTMTTDKFVKLTVAVPLDTTDHLLEEKYFFIFFSHYGYMYWRIHNLMESEVSE